MTALRINRRHHPVTVLGHGVRAGIWLQGCTIGCAGCASTDTWDQAGGTPVEPAELVGWLDGLAEPLDGVTISGGEPFQQPAALGELLAALAAWRGDRPIDLLVFSGYAWSRLGGRAEYATALAHCDAVVAGPYVERRNTGNALRGSDNQRIVPRTALGEARYGGDPARSPALQVFLEGAAVRLIGIPRRGDLDRLRAGLAARGVHTENVTWLG
ncbi:4Fe-4S cluster-binding domain-containing protein [Actinophytocola sediminis]